MVKVILLLFLLTAVFVFGAPAWDKIQQKVAEFTNPKVQRASILENLKNNLGDLEKIFYEVNENIDDPNFNPVEKIKESLEVIKETKENLANLEKTEPAEESLTEKTFKNLKDLKDGAKEIFFSDKTTSSQCQCSQE